MPYGASLLSGNTYHSNSCGGYSQTRHHYPTHTSPDSVINMNKVFGILLGLVVLASSASWGTTFKDGKISPVQPQVLVLADKRVV